MTRTLLIAAAALILLAGCQTTRQKQAAAQRQNWEDSIGRRMINLENQIRDLEDNLALLRREQNAIDTRVARILNNSSSLGAAQREEIEQLRKELAATRENNKQKIDIILEEVARENERILKSIRQGRGTAGYAQGYEHVVRSGETVSTIARQYGTTIEAIVAANELANPNSIRVGQILFVPE